MAKLGIGTETASALLVAAGDNPQRLRNECTVADLCGTARIDASNHERHRLNRGGDRQANSALWRIVITRMVYDPPHSPIHPAAHEPRPHQERSLPLPHALHRTGGLQPATHPARRPSTRGQAPREGCPYAQEVPAEFKRDVAVDVEVSVESVRGWGRQGDIDDVIKDDPTARREPRRE